MSTSTFPTRLLFRPEMAPDLDSLKELITPTLGKDRLSQVNEGPDDDAGKILFEMGGMVMAFEAKTRAELSTLILAIGEVEDGHRMLQTLDTAEHFTGDAFSDERERSGRILDLLGPEYERAGRIYMECNTLPDDTVL